MSNFYAIIPAAGIGKRFGGSVKKQFLGLGGRSLLEWSVGAFLKTKRFQRIVVCLPVDELVSISGKTDSPEVIYVAGGITRAQSVKKGFEVLKASDEDMILVHDAVRPLVGVDLILRVAVATKERGPTVPVTRLNDTIKEIKEGIVSKTIDRSSLFAVQTPQGFPAGVLKRIYQKLSRDDPCWTDEAMMAEAIGEKVYAVEGERRNIKVTTTEDLRIAECLCE
ncbi:MAG: 2-C-methyl-D-erythritol 4-phosphate cytidylyltransferase [Deltaproteobacteria bacterium]|nr:2-C-methyl-D-erythritol 4-phosphate cytidylyltransferase [Deltaproteobacteria bacterium]